MYLPDSESFIDGIGIKSTSCSHIIVYELHTVGSDMGHINIAYVSSWNAPVSSLIRDCWYSCIEINHHCMACDH